MNIKLDGLRRRTMTRKAVCDLGVWTGDLQNSQSAFLAIFGLDVTSTFDLSTSKFSKLIFVPTAPKL